MHRAGALLRDYSAEHTLPYDECGKLVVAVDGSERARLAALEATARGERRAGAAAGRSRRDRGGRAARRRVAALHSPHTAITDYVAVAERLAADVREAGGSVLLSTTVTGIERRPGGIDVVTGGAERHRVDRLVVCGGLESDRLGELAGGEAAPRIVPFRGEYLSVVPAKADLVRGMVYPVPDPRYPFLGVHFTRRVDGSLEIGPNAFLALSRRSYGRLSVQPADVARTLAWPGFWRFSAALAHRRHRAARRAVDRRLPARSAQRYVPEIGLADVRRAGSACGRRRCVATVRSSTTSSSSSATASPASATPVTCGNVQPGHRRARGGPGAGRLSCPDSTLQPAMRRAARCSWRVARRRRRRRTSRGACASAAGRSMSRLSWRW